MDATHLVFQRTGRDLTQQCMFSVAWLGFLAHSARSTSHMQR